MKKWKIIRILTISVLCIFILYTIWLASICYKRNVTYPYETVGAVQINNWIDAFNSEMIFGVYIVGIPLIIDIVFMIVSVIKIKKYKSQG